MDTELNPVSYLTINDETREIVDQNGRNQIDLLQAQINYIATELNIDLSSVSLEN